MDVVRGVVVVRVDAVEACTGEPSLGEALTRRYPAKLTRFDLN